MIAIDHPTTGYSNRASSHRGAWARYIRAEFLSNGEEATVLSKKDNLHDYDVLVIVLDVDHEGNSFNVFGGATDELADRLSRLLEFKGKIVCYNREMPDLGEWIKSRKSSCSDKFRELDHEAFSKLCAEMEVMFIPKRDKLVVGDSHSQSVWIPGYDLKRFDGKTLHTAIEELPSLIEGYSEVIIYFGNIDIRHHLKNHSVDELMLRYKKFLESLDKNIKVTLVHALPIEDPSRKIPKTGYFKGQPYHGYWHERDDIRKTFNDYIDEFCIMFGYDSLKWPSHYINEKGQLKFSVMEKPRSVHLSPEYYLIDYNTLQINKNFSNEN